MSKVQKNLMVWMQAGNPHEKEGVHDWSSDGDQSADEIMKWL